jgi:MFS family permease
VAVAALQHFLVDALCVCCLYMLAATRPLADLLSLFILYNVLAFLTQPLTGYVVDRLKHKHWMLLASMLLLTLATMITIVFGLCSNFSPPFREGLGEGLLPPFCVCLGVCLLGLGNSLFHVWGGQQVAVRTQNDMRSLGVFVSTGAFGLAVGVVFASWWLLFGLLLALCLLAIVVTLPRFLPARDCSNYSPPFREGLGEGLPFREGLGVGVLLLVMVIVALRSWLGEDLTAGITKTQTMVLLLGFTAMIGKAAGGFMCKWLGIALAVILMVVGTAVCYFLTSNPLTSNPLTSNLLTSNLPILLPLFLVNCTMPVTLWLANRLLPGREGLAFGLLAAALMPGYLLTDAALGAYAVPLVGTIIIELGVLYLLREHRSRVLWASVVVNVLTNLPLNLLVRHGWLGDLPSLLIAEAVIVVIESLWYYCFVRQWRQSFVYGLLCNAISFLFGMLFQLLYMIFLTL